MICYKIEHPKLGFRSDSQNSSKWTREGKIWSRWTGPKEVVSYALLRLLKWKTLGKNIYPEELEAEIVFYEMTEIERVPIAEYIQNKEWCEENGKEPPRYPSPPSDRAAK